MPPSPSLETMRWWPMREDGVIPDSAIVPLSDRLGARRHLTCAMTGESGVELATLPQFRSSVYAWKRAESQVFAMLNQAAPARAGGRDRSAHLRSGRTGSGSSADGGQRAELRAG